MSTLSDGWFELELDGSGQIRKLIFPWMKAPGETPVNLLESYGFIFIDDKIFLPSNTFLPAIDDLLKQSPAINRLVNDRASDEIVHSLPLARIEDTSNAHTIEYRVQGVQIERIAMAHPVHPVPAVTHRVTNKERRPIEVNYYWCVGTEGDCYGVLSEKGDMLPPILEMLGGQCAVYFINMLQTLRTRNTLLNWAYINLNFGMLEPNETKSFQVNLWAIKHLWVGTQFSGYGFVLSDQDPTTAVAAAVVTHGRNADGVSWLLNRLYSPIFVIKGNSLPGETRELLCRAPIRLLISNVKLDEDSSAFCAQSGIRVVYTPDQNADQFITIQQALDNAVGSADQQRRSSVTYTCPTIVNVLPDGADRQLLLGYYYSQRRDVAKIGDTLTVPASNIFIQASSLPDERYADLLKHASFIRLLGSQPELGVEIEQWLAQFGPKITRHAFDISPDDMSAIQAQLATRGLHFASERIASDGIMSHLISFFTNHDYTLPRLAIEGLFDPEYSPSAAFSAIIEKVTGNRDFWEAPVELIQEHGKLEIFGPPFSVIIPTSEWGDNEIFNAVIGAQYAKALRACLFPMHYLPEANQRMVRSAFKELRNQVYGLSQNQVDWHEIEDNVKVISSELMSCFDTLAKLLLRIGDFSKEARVSCGQHGVYLFYSDYSLPIELASRYEAFGRSNTIGTLTPFGRMAFKSPLQTALYGADNVLYQQTWYQSNAEVVLASDPTGDLVGSGVLEHTNVCVALGSIGVTPKLLTGLSKKSVIKDDVKSWSMSDSGPFRIIDSTKDEHGNIVDERVYEFDSPEDCNVNNFLAAITSSGGVHFTGHGEIYQQSQELVLADGNLSFGDFPRLEGHPWLLLNACELGQASDKSDSAMRLLEKGAIQVIAPLLAVRDPVVSKLGSLYGNFSIMSLPAAFQMARHDMFLESRQSTDHLAYVIYGDPFAYQGHKLWEAYEAYYCAVTGWQQAATKEKYNLYERGIYLWRLLITEAQRHFDSSGRRHWCELVEFFSERKDSSSGALYELIANSLSSSQQRLEYLAKASEAYMSAGQKRTKHRPNRTLMLAYGSQNRTTLQIESATLSFLDDRFTIGQLRNEFQDAVKKLYKTEAEFREIDALDADNCVVIREKLERIIQMLASKTSGDQFESAVKALLHTPRGELAQSPPLLSKLAEAQQASATPRQSLRSRPQLGDNVVHMRSFFPVDSTEHTEAASFLGDLLDGLQFFAEMRNKLYHGQLAPTDFMGLTNATLRLNLYNNRDRVQSLVNNALLKQVLSHWLYDDPGFQRQIPQELYSKLIGFSALFAKLNPMKIDVHIIRDYAQTYFDLFWEDQQQFYVALEHGKRLSLKRLDEITDKISKLTIDRKGQLRVNAGFWNLYKMRASDDEWADLYICMLFEENFRIPASQRFRIRQTELSIRFGVGGIIDIGTIALLVRGQNECFFYDELEKKLTEHLSARMDANSLAARIDMLAKFLRSRSTQDFIALGEALTRLGVEDESWSVLQSHGVAISMISTKEQEQKLAMRLADASGSVHQLIRRRFR